MKNLSIAILLTLAAVCATPGVVAQSETQQPSPQKKEPAWNSMALSRDEILEAEAALQDEQDKNGAVIQIVNDAMATTYDTQQALLIFGRLREAGANLRTAKVRRQGVLEKQRSSRPDCSECQYSADMRFLVKPAR